MSPKTFRRALRVSVQAAICATLMFGANTRIAGTGELILVSTTTIEKPDDDVVGAGLTAFNNNLYFSAHWRPNNPADDGEALIGQFAAPLANGAYAAWTKQWPDGNPSMQVSAACFNGPFSGNGFDALPGISATDQGLFLAGSSFFQTNDPAGCKEVKGVAVKYALSGAGGTRPAGEVWLANQSFFPASNSYGGGESFTGGVASTENGNVYFYAVGTAQSNGCNHTYAIRKYDNSGNTVWQWQQQSAVCGNATLHAAAVLGTNVYAAGTSEFAGNIPQILRFSTTSAGSGPNGTFSGTLEPGFSTGVYTSIAVVDGKLYAAGYYGTPGEHQTYLLDGWDANGARFLHQVWSSDPTKTNGQRITGLVAIGSRLFAVGWTRNTDNPGTAHNMGGDATPVFPNSGAYHGFADAVIFEVNPANGTILSTTSYGSNDGHDQAFTGATTDGTDLYVIGAERNAGGVYHGIVQRYNASLATSLTTVSGSATFGGTATLQATLTAGGGAVVGAPIHFSLFGSPVGSAVTNAGGVATLSGVPIAGKDAGLHANAVAASFAATGTFLGSSGAGPLAIAQAAPTITVSGAGAFIADGQPHAATATVTGVLSENLGAATITYTNVATNQTSSTPPSAPGTYRINAAYAGSTNYLPASNNSNLITITALDPMAGDLAVNVGASTLYKLRSWDGGIAWGPVPRSNCGGLAVDQGDFGVYTSSALNCTGSAAPSVHKYTASGSLAWSQPYSGCGSGGNHYVGNGGIAVDTTSNNPGVVLTKTGFYGDIGKVSRTTGATLFCRGTNDVGRPTIDPATGDIFTTTTANYNTLYRLDSNNNTLTLGTSCEGFTDLNPADGMLYRAGNMAANGCGRTLSQLNKSVPGAVNWTMDFTNVVGSVDSIAVQPWTGGLIYLGSTQSLRIIVVDPATRTIVNVFTTNIPPAMLAVSPKGGRVYVAGGNMPFVSAYDPNGAFLWQSVNLGGPIHTIAAPRNLVGSPAAPIPTTVTLTSSPNTSVFGEAVTMTATVSSPGGTPTGNVTFKAGASVLGTVPLDASGRATLSSSALPVGPHAISVLYAGDGVFSGSTSSVISHTVQTAATTTSVSSAPNPSMVGQTVTFTAAVTANAPGTGTPTGSVTFFDGGTSLGSATLSGGTATFSTANVAGGSRAITAQYSGTPNFNASTSAVLNHMVTRIDSTTSVTVSPNPATFGDPVTFTASVSAGSAGFGPPVHFNSGSDPRAVAIADFNADGKLDMAVANWAANNISVRLGNGTGGFGSATTYGVIGANPSAIAVFDWNGDGRLDLAVTNFSTGNLNVFTGTGSGTFNGAISSSIPGSGPMAIAVIDLFTNGVPELLIASSNTSTATLMVSSGNGVFNAWQTFLVGPQPRSIGVGDFNVDGFPDAVVMASSSSTHQILTGTSGSSGLSMGGTVGIGGQPFAVAVHDFNRDGKPDLAAASHGSSNVRVALGNGNGTFGPTTNFPVGTNPTGIVGGDFDGDTIADLVVANFASSNVSLLRGDGMGSFIPAGHFVIHTQANPLSIAAGDLNGDGKRDLIVPNLNLSAASVLLNTTPTVVFTKGTTVLGSGLSFTTSALAAGDHTVTATFPGDNTYNASSGSAIVTINKANSTAMLTSSANPSQAGDPVTFTATVNAPVPAPIGFGVPTVVPAGSNPRAVVAADFNGDALPDLALMNSSSGTASIQLRTPAGTFSGPTNVSVGSSPLSMLAGDVNTDGKLDLVVTGNTATGNLRVLLGNGAGGFAPPALIDVGTGFSKSSAAADFNGDGFLDLAVSHPGQFPVYYVGILLGNGAGGFGPATNFPIGLGPTNSIAVADLDRDGVLDLATANQTSNDVSVLLGDGSGGFGPAAAVPAGEIPRMVVAVDINVDSKLDLGVVGGNFDKAQFSVLLGDGTGAFGPRTAYPAGTSPSALAAADFNADGAIDFAIGDSWTGNTLIVYPGLGGGTLGSAVSFAAGTHITGLTTADFNADGRLDVAVSNSNSAAGAVVLNSSATGATGTIQFRNNGAAIGTAVPLAGGKATLVTTMATGGSFNITADYSGDHNFLGATSNTVVQAVTFVNHPPAITSTGGPYVINIGQDLVLTATADDPDEAHGDSLAFQWDLNNDGQFDDASAASTGVTWSELIATLGVTDSTMKVFQGTIRVRAIDQAGVSALAATTLTIYPNVVVPSLTIGNTVCSQATSLDASGSHQLDARRAIVKYEWEFGDGTPQYSESTSSAPDGAFDGKTTHVYTKRGQFAVTLTVTDDLGTSASLNAVAGITIQNRPPAITSTGGPYVTNIGDDLLLMASTEDPDASCGDSLTYRWDLDSDGTHDVVTPDPVTTVTWSQLQAVLGINQATQTATQTTVALSVADLGGATASATTSLTVYPDVIVPALTVVTGQCSQSTSFDASSSHNLDPRRKIVEYEWDFGDGSARYTETAGSSGDGLFDGKTTHTYSHAGAFTVVLKVVDDRGAIGTTTAAANVTYQNLPPLANAGGPYAVNYGGAVTLNAAASSDPNASCGDSIVIYEWDFNDQFQLSGPSPVLNTAINPLPAGTHTITLTVRDAQGLTATASTTVNVRRVLVSIEVTPAPVALHRGERQQFTAIGQYNDGSSAPLASSNSGGGHFGPNSPAWQVQFPQLADFSACATEEYPLSHGSGSFRSQNLLTQNGSVDMLWSAGTPVVRVQGSVNPLNVALTLACTNGAGAGTIDATWTGTRYEGQISFNGVVRPVTITGWSGKTAMPGARMGLAATTLGGKVYAIGGVAGSCTGQTPCTFAPLRDVGVYDPATDSWSGGPELNIGREGARAVTIGNTAYVIGGHVAGGQASGSVEMLDSSIGHDWVELTADPMPTPRKNFALVTDGTYAYALGGETTPGNPLTTVERFDPAAPAGTRWATLDSMPAAGTLIGAGVLGNTIVVVGAGNSSRTDIYTIGSTSNGWSTGVPMPAARAAMAAAVANGGLWLTGGTTNGTANYDTWVYYPQTVNRSEGWAGVGSALTGRSMPAAAVVGDVIYVVGGSDAANVALATTESLSLPPFEDLSTSGGNQDDGPDTVTWHSTNTSVATIDASGFATAGTIGETTIVATSGNISCGSMCATLNVVNSVPSVQIFGGAVSITESNFQNFSTGASFSDVDQQQWSATVDYGDGSGVQPLMIMNQQSGFTPTGQLNLSHRYRDEGVFTVTVRVDDGAGGVGTATTTVTVNNVAPSVTIFGGGSAQIDEGFTFFGSGNFADPGADSWTATVDYGDGTGVQPLQLNNVQTGFTPNGGFNLNHHYPGSGTFTVTVTINDGDGGIGVATRTVNVANRAPQVFGPQSAMTNVGNAMKFACASFNDVANDAPFTATVNYGDGSGDQPVTPNVPGNCGGGGTTAGAFDLSHVYTTGGTFTVTVKVTDKDLATGMVRFPVTVNAPPGVTINNLMPIDEGGTLSGTASFTDAPDDGPWTIRVDYGDNTGGFVTLQTVTPGSTFSLGSHQYRDNGTYNVRVEVTDKGNLTGTANTTLVVNNVAPTVALGNLAPITEGQTTSFTVRFSDPGLNDNFSPGFTAQINWGDGTPIEQRSNASFNNGTGMGTFQVNHTYADNPPAPDTSFTITVTVKDKDGAVSIAKTVPLIVNNAAPSLQLMDAQRLVDGEIATIRGQLSDPGAFDAPWTGTVDFGDGSPVQPVTYVPNAPGQSPRATFTLTHTYHWADIAGQNGQVTLTLTATDKDGATSTRLFSLKVKPAMVSVSIDPSGPVWRNAVGQTVAFNAVAHFSDGGSQSTNGASHSGVTWSSSNPNVATILPNGLATVVGPGVTTITAVADDGLGHTFTAAATLTVDVAAPVIAAADITVEATSAAGAHVSLVFSATDDFDPSPLVTADRASGTYALGTTDVVITATDRAGNISHKTIQVSVVDTTPPALTVPANITTDATSPDGTVVTYAVSAVDLVGGTVPVTCSKPSGTVFPIGTTTTTCTAADGAGNVATGTFTVLVQTAAAQVTNLVATVHTFNLARGIENSLDAKLQNILTALGAARTGNAPNVCGQLSAFINQTQAQSGKQLTASQADQLIAAALRIRAVVGCQ